MPKKHGPSLLLVMLLGLLLCSEGPAQAQRLVGGPCRYADFPGTATIVAVTPATKAEHDGPSPEFKVTFTFAPKRPILGEPLYVADKTHVLTLTGGRRPGRQFVEHYGLRPGRHLPCRLRLIRQGTCTPVLFEFPEEGKK